MSQDRQCPNCGVYGIVQELYRDFVKCVRCDHLWDATGKEKWAAKDRPPDPRRTHGGPDRRQQKPI